MKHSFLRAIGVIAGKELKAYFNSPVAYVVIVVFLGLVGYFFQATLFLNNIASLRVVFDTVPVVFLFIVPAVTMRLLSEEWKGGTMELLITKPVRDAEIVLGKFLAAWAFLAAALLPTLFYYATIASLGAMDHGPVIGGYLGLLLMGGVYAAAGLFGSSVTQNQIVAFIIGFLIVFFLFLVDKTLMLLPSWLAGPAGYLGIEYHFSGIARGVIDTRNIVYFFSMIAFFLYLTTVSMERRSWS